MTPISVISSRKSLQVKEGGLNYMNTGLDQYMDIFKDAVEDSAAKLTKSFEKILIEVIILFMVIPRIWRIFGKYDV